MFSKLKNLFNSNSSAVGASHYKDFQIVPTPKKNSGAYTTEGKIFKEIGGIKMSAYFIRTDTFSKKDDDKSESISEEKEVKKDNKEG